MYVDKMPAAVCEEGCKRTNYDELIPIGYKGEDGQYYLYNHMDFHVTLSQRVEDVFQIVGFRIEPKSIHYKPDMVEVLNVDSMQAITNKTIFD